jgi:predicted porin
MKYKFITTIPSTVLAGIFISGLAGNVQAENFDYNYIQGAYESIDLDGPDADVFRLSGSYEFTPQLTFIGEYATGDIDNPTGGSDLDFEETVIGLGYHTELMRSTDLTANIKVINQDTDLAGDDTGYGLGVGLRHKLADNIEVNANVDFVDVNQNEDTSLELGARYYFSKAYSAGLSYSSSTEDVDVVSGNIRWDF